MVAGSPPRLLLTGATGFVGRAVLPALLQDGWDVRALTRSPTGSRPVVPHVEWMQGDVADRDSCAAALNGCTTAIYLVHAIGSSGDYHTEEVRAAETFASCAADAGVERIIYLGGVAPAGPGSEHLRSRLDAGAALRAGNALAIELRASMIVGVGSLSWLIVRDLAARLPFMILPRWLKSRTEPVSIDDIVIALTRALRMPLEQSAWYDVPGPQIMSGREILEETARVMGLPRPVTIEVPLLTPELSSHWIRFVTRADWSVAREVVLGLGEDLLAKDDSFWHMIGHTKRQSFEDAARNTLRKENEQGPVQGTWGAVERFRRAGGR